MKMSKLYYTMYNTTFLSKRGVHFKKLSMMISSYHSPSEREAGSDEVVSRYILCVCQFESESEIQLSVLAALSCQLYTYPWWRVSAT